MTPDPPMTDDDKHRAKKYVHPPEYYENVVLPLREAVIRDDGG